MIKSSSSVDASGVGDLIFLGAPYFYKLGAASEGPCSVSFPTVSTGPVSAGTEGPNFGFNMSCNSFGGLLYIFSLKGK
jgi:hypothetical protein